MDDQPITWNDVFELQTDIKAMAERLLLKESDPKSLGAPTALMNTALRRQRGVGQSWEDVVWKNQDAFFRALYTSMRHALIDHARKRKAAPRAHLRDAADLDLLKNFPTVANERPELFDILDVALKDLEGLDPKLAHVVYHRYYGGLEMRIIGRLMGKDERTIFNWLREAEAILRNRVEIRMR